MEFLIISGLSGAGKSRTMDILEDLNFYCVDNMPVALITKFAELCIATRSRYEKVALVSDVRALEGTHELLGAIDELRDMGCDYRILFVEADTKTILKHYKETRRRHPLATEGGAIEEAVQREIELLEPLKKRADYIINTSKLTLGMLQSEIYAMFMGDTSRRTLVVNVMSFGFKHGIPLESDLVFDVRFLPNPFYVSELREKTGEDKAVQDFVLKYEDAKSFLAHLEGMLEFLLPLYLEEGKYSLTVAIGCTGGRHRSVTIAREIAGFVESQGHKVKLIHRDLGK